MEQLVINSEKAMEVQHLLVPLRHGFHLAILLITNDMVDIEELWDGNDSV